jgi:Na+/melibiose symporter-like transporter
MSDLPPRGQTYRATAILYAILSLLIVLVAALSGGGLVKATIIAVVFFVVATGWSWFRLRQRDRRPLPRDQAPPDANGRP